MANISIYGPTTVRFISHNEACQSFEVNGSRVKSLVRVESQVVKVSDSSRTRVESPRLDSTSPPLAPSKSAAVTRMQRSAKRAACRPRVVRVVRTSIAAIGDAQTISNNRRCVSAPRSRACGTSRTIEKRRAAAAPKPTAVPGKKTRTKPTIRTE